MQKLYALFIVFLLLSSCEKSKDTITLVESSGRINHLLVVMNNQDWEGRLGDSLRNILAEPVLGLPQEEAQFSVNQVDPGAFSSLFKRTRNVLYIDLADKDAFYQSLNSYAAPQTILTILGADMDSLLKSLEEHKAEIIQVFKKQDLALYQKKITANHWSSKKINTMKNLGFTMDIPQSYNEVDDSGDFLWYRYNFTKGMLNLIAYEFPVKDASEFTPQRIIKVRDSIGRIHIPGQFENTHMKTEPLYNPAARKIELDGRPAYEIRGLWIIKNDYMGGPFINYAIFDEPNNRVLVVEGFSYSPAVKKRDFVFEMEAILRTVNLTD